MYPSTAGNQTVTTVSPPRGYVLSGKIMLSGIVVLFSIVLFILFLHLYVRWHVIRRHNRRRRRRNRLIFTAAEGRTPLPRGLDKQVLGSLPVDIFSDDDVADADCAVCLSEFDEGEKVRVLPRCGHRFHIECIDMWFSSHSSCPLCRSAVETVTSSAPAAESESDPDPAEASDPDPQNPEARIEIPEEPESTSGGVQVKLPVYSGILIFRRFLIGDARPVRTGNSDLEGGEPVNGSSPPSPTLPPAPSAQ